MQQIDKNLKILIAITAVFMIGISISAAITQSEIGALMVTTRQQIVYRQKPRAQITTKAVLIIDFGEGEIERFDKNLKEKTTAFDLLKEGTEKLNLPLETKTYDIGILIEAIGDKKNGQDGKYWLYYVNGEAAMVSADKKEINPEDKIEFKFESSPF